MTPMTLPSLPTIGTETSDWKLLLLELRDVLDARVVEQLVADERGLLVLGRPPGETLAPLERDLADEVRVGLRGGAQHEAFVLDQVDEARVDGARVGQEPDDGTEDLLELERRSDRRDDRVEEPAFAGMGARRAYAGMLSRNPRRVTRGSAMGGA